MKRADGEGCFNYVEKKNLWRYIVSFPEGSKTFYGKLRKDCMEKANRYRKERERNGYAVHINTPFSAYYEHYLREFEKTGSPTSVALYRNLRTTMQKPAVALFDLPLNTITPETIRTYFESLQDVVAYSTAKRIRSILRQTFALAVEENLFSKNPVTRISLKEQSFQPTRERNFLTETEAAAFLRYLEPSDEPMDQMLIFLMNTGLRIGELLGLRWEDVRNNCLYITNNRVRIGNTYVDKCPKSKAGIRVIPLNDKARSILQYFSSLEQKHERYVFVEKNGHLPEREAIRYHLRKACLGSGVPMVSIHELRHTFGSLLLEKGVDIKVISTLMGHSSVAITYAVYIHLADAKMKDAVGTLNAIG